MDTKELSFKIDRKAIKVRKSWGEVNPATKVQKTDKKKREQNNLRRQIYEAMNGVDDENDE